MKIKEKQKQMQLLDVYTKKEYKCPICGDAIYYAKIADNSGKLVTKDGQLPNGKFGKDTNVLSGAVDVNVKDRLHKCTAAKTTDQYNTLSQGPMDAINSGGTVLATAEVKWNVSHGLTELQSKLKEGLVDLTSVAYQVTKEQHPDLSDQNGLFGQIVSAKTTVLSNLVIAENLKKLREELANKS